MINLISNAIKYTKEGFVMVKGERCSYINDVNENRKYLKISVIDSGVGMNEDDMSNLFNLYGKL
jgi:two-component system sensor histidine kinase/response regulator